MRVRPLTNQEKSKDSWKTLDVTNQQLITLKDPRDITVTNDPLVRSRESQFAFDVALDTGATTRDLYDSAMSGIVDTVLKGEHATVFAYGATGSGKTCELQLGD